MFQPRPSSARAAFSAVTDQVDRAALVPPLRPMSPLTVLPLLTLPVLMETRMFSMDCAVKSQLVQACSNSVQAVESKRLAGKVASDVQFLQAILKPAFTSAGVPTAALKSRAGKAVKPLLPCQAE